MSFVDRMVELLPYKPYVPGSIPGDGPDFFGYYVRVMDNVLLLTICVNYIIYGDIDHVTTTGNHFIFTIQNS